MTGPRRGAGWAAIACLATGLSPAMPAPAVAQGQVEAGGQRCINWQFVRQVQGVNDSSYVQYANTCPAPVAFFWCETVQFQPDSRRPCDPRFGGYSSTVAPPGWSRRSSVPARGQLIVTVRECPAGYRPGSIIDGRISCVR